MVDLIRTIPYPAGITTLRGMDFNGKYLYALDLGNKNIVEMDLDGKVIRLIPDANITTSDTSLVATDKYLIWYKHSGTILRVLDYDGVLIKTISLSSWASSSGFFAWDGKHFWFENRSTSSRVQMRNETGVIIKSWSIPWPGSFTGIFFDGRNLYKTNASSGLVYKVDRDGKIIQTYDCSTFCASLEGLCTDGKYFYLYDYANEEIYQVAFP